VDGGSLWFLLKENRGDKTGRGGDTELVSTISSPSSTTLQTSITIDHHLRMRLCFPITSQAIA